MTESHKGLPPGSLELLVLRTLDRHQELHGFEIAERIAQASREVLQVEEGSLYPALQRMLVKGWIAGEWGRTSGNRRARYYRLTATGRKELLREMAAYQRQADAIRRVLQPS